MYNVFLFLLACSDKADDSVEPELEFVGMDFNLESADGYELVADGVIIFFPEGSDFSFCRL